MVAKAFPSADVQPLRPEDVAVEVRVVDADVVADVVNVEVTVEYSIVKLTAIILTFAVSGNVNCKLDTFLAKY